jgi:hypothetical protein
MIQFVHVGMAEVPADSRDRIIQGVYQFAEFILCGAVYTEPFAAGPAAHILNGDTGVVLPGDFGFRIE